MALRCRHCCIVALTTLFVPAASRRSANYDPEEFEDFLSKVDDINKTIQGLADGTVDIDKIDKKDQEIKRQQDEKEAKKAAKRAEEQAKIQARIDERKRLDEYKEANREKLQELKEDYYLRKAKREKWLEFRESNRSRAFSDYYKGWDLFEEDPDEELFCNPDKPAAVQDQGAFDSMAKDIEERTKKRKADQAACAKEREAANLAFKAGQFSEAVAGYSRALEHFRGDKTAMSNRAAAHLKLRNFLSALDDCSRVMEIATFLDNDAQLRPPPPPLLKAYVRRASAQTELGRYTEAAEDLATALAMAPEAEKAEIKRQQKMLKEDVAAEKREAAIEAAKGGGGSGGDEATADRQQLRGQVRELLEELKTNAEASAAALDELIAAADAIDVAAETGAAGAAGAAGASAALGAALADEGSQLASAAGGPASVTDPRVRAANLAVSRQKSEAAAAKALNKLTELARDSAAARVCIRHAGGVKLLLGLLAKACAQSRKLAEAAGAKEGGKDGKENRKKATKQGKGAEDIRRVGKEEAAAESYGWAGGLAKLLQHASLERRNQREFHLCGGTTQVLRELRKLVAPSAATGHANANEQAGASEAALGALAPQLRLLALCCEHETVSNEARRLASGEGAHERLLALMLPAAEKADAKVADAKVPADVLVSAVMLIASLCVGSPRAKQELLPFAKPLCAALGTHVTARSVALAEQAATALGNLSAHSKFRKAIIDGPALHKLLDAIHAITPGRSDAEQTLLPNALAALHNCSLSADAIGFVTSVELATALLPRLEAAAAAGGGGGAGYSTVLVRRATAVLAKCAARHASVVESINGGPVVGALVKTLVDEGKAVEKAKDAPRIVEITPGGAEAEAEAADEDEAESAAAEEELVGSALRVLTACAQHEKGQAAICDGGGLPCLVKLLQRDDTSLQGNAALCIANCSKDDKCLAVLAVQDVVPQLLAICHNGAGGPQKNAAVALGRLSRNPRMLAAIRDNHGIEILARAMKGKVAGL